MDFLCITLFCYLYPQDKTSQSKAAVSKGPLKEESAKAALEHQPRGNSTPTSNVDPSDCSTEILAIETSKSSSQASSTSSVSVAVSDSLALSLSCSSSKSVLEKSVDNIVRSDVVQNHVPSPNRESPVLVSHPSQSGSSELLSHPSSTGSPDLELVLCPSPVGSPGPVSCPLSCGSPSLELGLHSSCNGSPSLELVRNPSLIGSPELLPRPSSSSPGLELVPHSSQNGSPVPIPRPSSSSPKLELVPYPSSEGSRGLQLMPCTTSNTSPMVSRPSSTGSLGSDVVPVGYLVPVQMNTSKIVSHPVQGGSPVLVGSPPFGPAGGPSLDLCPVLVPSPVLCKQPVSSQPINNTICVENLQQIKCERTEPLVNPPLVGSPIPVGSPVLIGNPGSVVELAPVRVPSLVRSPSPDKYPSPVQFPSTDSSVLVLDPVLPPNFGQVQSPIICGNSTGAANSPVIVEVPRSSATSQHDEILNSENVDCASPAERSTDTVHEKQLQLAPSNPLQTQAQFTSLSDHQALSNNSQLSLSPSDRASQSSHLSSRSTLASEQHSSHTSPHKKEVSSPLNQGHRQQHLNPHSSIFIPKMTPVADDDGGSLEANNLPHPNSFNMKIQAYR